ncbi:hypothetical protein PG984_009768 [Apiospora sp. TS-2023a]
MLRGLGDRVEHLGLLLGIEPLVHVRKSSGSGVVCYRGRLATLAGGDRAPFVEDLLDEGLGLLLQLLLFARLGLGLGLGLVFSRLGDLDLRRSWLCGGGGGGGDLAVFATDGVQLIALRGSVLVSVTAALVLLVRIAARRRVWSGMLLGLLLCYLVLAHLAPRRGPGLLVIGLFWDGSESRLVMRRTGTLGIFLVVLGRDLVVFSWLFRYVLWVNFLGGNLL